MYQREIYNISSKDRGYIYLIKVWYYEAVVKVDDGNGAQWMRCSSKETLLGVGEIVGNVELFEKYKYGKTKNLKRRLAQYEEKFNGNVKLISSYKTNHLTIKEELIKSEYQDPRPPRSEYIDINPDWCDKDWHNKVNQTIKEISESEVVYSPAFIEVSYEGVEAVIPYDNLLSDLRMKHN